MTPKHVRARRIALGLSVPDLAAALGVSVELLQDFEEGRKELPNIERCQSILDRLEGERQRERSL